MTVHYMHHSGSPSAFRPMKWCTTYTILTCLLSRHRQNGALHAPFWLTFSLSAHEMVYHVRHSDLFAVTPSTKWCTTCTILAYSHVSPTTKRCTTCTILNSPSAFRPMRGVPYHSDCLLSRHQQNGAHAPFCSLHLSAHEMVYHVRHSACCCPPSTKRCTVHHSQLTSAFRPMKWCHVHHSDLLLSRHRQNGALHAFWLTFSLSAHEMVYRTPF